MGQPANSSQKAIIVYSKNDRLQGSHIEFQWTAHFRKTTAHLIITLYRFGLQVLKAHYRIHRRVRHLIVCLCRIEYQRFKFDYIRDYNYENQKHKLTIFHCNVSNTLVFRRK